MNGTQNLMVAFGRVSDAVTAVRVAHYLVSEPCPLLEHAACDCRAATLTQAAENLRIMVAAWRDLA